MNHLKYFLSICLFTTSFFIYSQNIVFEKKIGGTDDEVAFDVIPVSTGGYAVFGWTRSPSNGGTDFYLVKTDDNGNELWSQNYGTGQNESGLAILETSDAGFILAGTQVTGSTGDQWIVKVNSTGVYQWDVSIGGAGDDYIRDIVETSDGGFAVSGFTNSYGNGGKDFYVSKLSSSGVVEWTSTFGGSQDEEGWSIIEMQNGDISVGGWTESYGNGLADFYLVRMDNLGNEIWSNSYGGSSNDSGLEIYENASGEIIFAGGTWSSGAGQGDAWLLNISSVGVLNWSQTYGGTGVDYCRSITKTNTGYSLIGYSDVNGGTGYDFYLISVDDLGNEILSDYYGGTSNDEAWKIKSDGFELLLVGQTESNTAGGIDMYFLKLNDVASIDETGSNYDVDVEIFPNPVYNEFKVKVSNELLGGEIYVYSSDGRLIDLKDIENIETEFDTVKLASGVYFINIVNGDYSITKKIIK